MREASWGAVVARLQRGHVTVCRRYSVVCGSNAGNSVN